MFEVPWTNIGALVASCFGFGHSFMEQSLDVIVHSSNVCLIYHHTFSSEMTGVVDGVLLILGVLIPIFVENQKNLLGSAEGKDRQ